MAEKKTLGIIGGMGPMATAYLLQLIIEMTDAKTDQEHLDVIVFNRPAVPDRTAYILDNTKPSPLPVLRDAAQKLTGLGAGVLCAPCVTSHYFYEALSGGIPVPFVHMLRETAEELRRAGRRKTGVMATTGTVRMGLFQSALGEAGIEAQLPSPACQELVMSMIYDEIKAGKPASPEKFQAAEEELYAQGCDSIVLGCTELSLIKKSAPLGPGYLDALEVLSKRCVQLCGGALKAEYENLLT
ncbi:MULTISPECIES: aspartate/glutamate racemase family protein [unclassified Neglectibacter]|uniref:aspartate/glutamate racemase family protein n=1 Tax=unclassified Neglectibacter TaxID=2632164 RepID=UPI001EF09670|nr:MULTISPECIES: amino acid racemase [unclassified Neglectibacter]